MAKLLHIFYHKEGTFSLLCQQVQLFTHSPFIHRSAADNLYCILDIKKSRFLNYPQITQQLNNPCPLIFIPDR